MDQKLGKGPGHLLSIDDGTHAWPEVVEMLMSSFTFGSKWGPKASGEGRERIWGEGQPYWGITADKSVFDWAMHIWQNPYHPW